MVTIVIDEQYCKGCGLCIHYCPKMVFEKSDRMNTKGYSIPRLIAPERCSKCETCELICPELAITVKESGT